MTPTVHLGRVGGVPVGAHWSVLVIVGLVAQILAIGVLPAAVPGQLALAYWLTGLAGAVLFLAGLLAHELAHAAVVDDGHVVGLLTTDDIGHAPELERLSADSRPGAPAAVSGG